MEKVAENRLNTDEIVIMCKRLANKYHMYHMKDDLVSEGVLAIYERLSVNPEEYPYRLYRIAKGALYAYVNIKSRALAIPVNDTTIAVALGKVYNEGEEWRMSTYSDEGIEAIYDALQGSVEYNYLHAETPDCSSEYEIKDMIVKCMDLLTEKERQVIEMRYFDEMKQDQVGDIYGVSQKTVSMWESDALQKMSKV